MSGAGVFTPIGFKCDACGSRDVQTESWCTFDVVRQQDMPEDHSGGEWYCPDCANGDTDSDGHGASVSDYQLTGRELRAAIRYRQAEHTREHAAALVKAGAAVVKAWERGDLAGAVRKLAAVIEAARGQA